MTDQRRHSQIRFRQAPGNQHRGYGSHFLPGIGHPRYLTLSLAIELLSSSTGVIYCTDRATELGPFSEDWQPK